MKALSNRSLYTINNKAAVWTLGLTILSAINLEDLSTLYRDGGQIDCAQVKRLVESVGNQSIRIVLAKMLKPAVYERASFT